MGVGDRRKLIKKVVKAYKERAGKREITADDLMGSGALGTASFGD